MKNLEKAEHLVRNHPANKELMKLVDGCELEVEGEVYIFGSEPDFCWKYKRKGIEYYDPGCGCCSISRDLKEYKILGKPAQLQHYLSVSESGGLSFELMHLHNGNEYIGLFLGAYEDANATELFKFNLTTGKPATEKDAEEFIKLVESV